MELKALKKTSTIKIWFLFFVFLVPSVPFTLKFSAFSCFFEPPPMGGMVLANNHESQENSHPVPAWGVGLMVMCIRFSVVFVVVIKNDVLLVVKIAIIAILSPPNGGMVLANNHESQEN